MDDVTAFFSTTYSLSSILNLEIPKKKDGVFDTTIDNNAPVSLVTLALKYDIPKTVIIEKNITNFWEVYKAFKEVGREYVFGWKTTICADSADKSEESKNTECAIAILFKNSSSYYKAVRYITKANCSNFYGHPRLDWNELNELNSEGHFEILMPFYSGFIYENLMKYGSAVVPRWGKLAPIFCLESHDLPFDELIRNATIKYATENNYEMLNTHQIYAFKDEDTEALQVYRAILQRSSIQKPEMSNFSSTSFTYESYLRKIGKSIIL